MEYLILAFVIFAVVALITHFFNKRSQKDKIEQIRFAWGRPKTESFHFEGIRKYDDRIKENHFHRLAEQTMEDIDFYGLFSFIDRTTSKIGQQFLFRKMMAPTNLAEDPSQDLITLLANDQKLREEVQLELSKLNDSDAYHIQSLLQERLLARPKWFKFLVLDIIIVISLFLLSFKFPVLLIVLLLPVIINVNVHYWNKGNTYRFIRSFPQLNRLIYVSSAISKKNKSFYSDAVDASVSSLRSFQQKATLINFNNSTNLQGELSQVVTYFFELVKAFFLIEVFTLFRVTSELETKQEAVRTLFDYVGNIDTCISIASLRAGTLKTCRPLFTQEKKEIVTKGIYHPLIHHCVTNDLSITGKSILITGSNMSGKSTFLRTLIVNSILAQTIYTVFADEFVSPIVKQFSSIRIDDNLFQGKSYYFQEVGIMGSLLAEVEWPHQNLFVLDEVFKGTNTIERIAAAKGILSYLNRNNNMVTVSTHDIELSDMLESEYDLYHFTETIEEKTLHFDHKIKPGPIKTTNAIKLLELSNYPADVVNEAKQVSALLRKAKTL